MKVAISDLYWPAPPTIHRGLEWPQCLNCLFVCLYVCLIVCSGQIFSFFFSSSSSFIVFSSVIGPLPRRSTGDYSGLSVWTVCLSVCLFVWLSVLCKFSHLSSPHPPMFSYSLYVVCCLYVTFLLPPERTTKAGPCHLYFYYPRHR